MVVAGINLTHYVGAEIPGNHLIEKFVDLGLDSGNAPLARIRSDTRLEKVARSEGAVAVSMLPKHTW